MRHIREADPQAIAMMLKAIQGGTPSLFTTIHVLDLAFVFPALIVAVVGLSRRQPWSYVLAGPLLMLEEIHRALPKPC